MLTAPISRVIAVSCLIGSAVAADCRIDISQPIRELRHTYRLSGDAAGTRLLEILAQKGYEPVTDATAPYTLTYDADVTEWPHRTSMGCDYGATTYSYVIRGGSRPAVSGGEITQVPRELQRLEREIDGHPWECLYSVYNPISPSARRLERHHRRALELMSAIRECRRL